jgi:hypothetical protein
MILPHPDYHPPRARPTCQDVHFARTYARAVALLAQDDRTPAEDADLLQAALCCTEGAALLGRWDLRGRATALLVRAQVALGHHQAAAVQRQRLRRLVGSEAAAVALLMATDT